MKNLFPVLIAVASISLTACNLQETSSAQGTPDPAGLPVNGGPTYLPIGSTCDTLDAHMQTYFGSNGCQLSSDGWNYYDYIGYINDAQWPWVYHEKIGWFWVQENSSDASPAQYGPSNLVIYLADKNFQQNQATPGAYAVTPVWLQTGTDASYSHPISGVAYRLFKILPQVGVDELALDPLNGFILEIRD